MADDDAVRPDFAETLLAGAREGRFENCYGRYRVHYKGGETLELGAFPPAKGDFVTQAAIYHSGLRFFMMSAADPYFEEPNDWALCRRMMDAGVRYGMIDEFVFDKYESRLRLARRLGRRRALRSTERDAAGPDPLHGPRRRARRHAPRARRRRAAHGRLRLVPPRQGARAFRGRLRRLLRDRPLRRRRQRPERDRTGAARPRRRSRRRGDRPGLHLGRELARRQRRRRDPGRRRRRSARPGASTRRGSRRPSARGRRRSCRSTCAANRPTTRRSRDRRAARSGRWSRTPPRPMAPARMAGGSARLGDAGGVLLLSVEEPRRARRRRRDHHRRRRARRPPPPAPQLRHPQPLRDRDRRRQLAPGRDPGGRPRREAAAPRRLERSPGASSPRSTTRS